MANKEKVLVIRGEIHWCKLLGEARPYTGNPRYDKGPYWAVDITPDGPSLQKLEDAGLTRGGKNGTGKLREPKGEKETRKEKYLTLSMNENRADGKKNKPPVVQDAEGKDWDSEREIGNGSIADIMVKVVDYGEDMKGLYYQKMRVLELVEYEGKDFEPLSEEDEFFARREKVKDLADEVESDNDGDDDIPF